VCAGQNSNSLPLTMARCVTSWSTTHSTDERTKNDQLQRGTGLQRVRNHFSFRYSSHFSSRTSSRACFISSWASIASSRSCSNRKPAPSENGEARCDGSGRIYPAGAAPDYPCPGCPACAPSENREGDEEARVQLEALREKLRSSERCQEKADECRQTRSTLEAALKERDEARGEAEKWKITSDAHCQVLDEELDHDAMLERDNALRERNIAISERDRANARIEKVREARDEMLKRADELWQGDSPATLRSQGMREAIDRLDRALADPADGETDGTDER
jgi:hypothetical protein